MLLDLAEFHDLEQEANLTAILDSTYNGIVAINNQGIITLFNSAAEKFTGHLKEKAIGKHINLIIPSTGLLKILANGKASFSQRIDINNRPMISNRTPMFRGGKVVGAVGVFQDLSALEHIALELERLKDLNTELDTIIATCSDAVVLTNGNGIVEKVNPAYERMSGLRSSDIVGKHIQELVDSGSISDSVSMAVLREGRQMNVIQQMGTGREIFFTGVPIFNHDKQIVKVISTGRDLTELNFVKSELERAKKMTAFYHTELEQLRKQSGEMGNLVFSSEKMRLVFDLAVKVAKVDSTVLLLGESGVGKEVMARLIHSLSKRAKQPMIKVNCAAVPEHLLESEFFGYSDGAFTGARKGGKAGLFETADGSTVFLDEIGELPLNLQAKLLRVLQEKELLRVGSSTPVKVDIRIITATNRDLAQLVKEKKFREDLFYRLNVVPITVPPLRERKEDLIPLVFYFLRKINEKYSMKKSFASSLIDKLINHDWPGNVRELENIIERMVIVSNDDEITEKDLPPTISQETRESEAISVNRILPLKSAVDELEKKLVERALEQFKSIRGAAKALGINASTIVRKKRTWDKHPYV